MEVEQFVMAYGAEQDRLRALLPEGFVSLRPVLRMNGEIRNGGTGWLELNTAVEHRGVRGWLNIACWQDVSFRRMGETVEFSAPLLDISFTGVGIQGGCPAEKDNGGCFFLREGEEWLRLPETVTANKEFCDCRFAWKMPGGASGVSLGKTLPAIPEEERTRYPRRALTAENAGEIPCRQVLGAYRVRLER